MKDIDSKKITNYVSTITNKIDCTDMVFFHFWEVNMNEFWLEFFSFRKMVSATILKFIYVIALIAITVNGIARVFS